MITKNDLLQRTGVAPRKLARLTKEKLIPQPIIRKLQNVGEITEYYPEWVLKRVRKIIDLEHQGIKQNEIREYFELEQRYAGIKLTARLIEAILRPDLNSDAISLEIGNLDSLQDLTSEEVEECIEKAALRAFLKAIQHEAINALIALRSHQKLSQVFGENVERWTKHQSLWKAGDFEEDFGSLKQTSAADQFWQNQIKNSIKQIKRLVFDE